jgi:hypothetical protein
VSSRAQGILGLVGLLLLIAIGARARASALQHPVFHAERPDGLLRSDPALLLYLTERIRENGGWPPDDFRADPRIQHPALTDLPAELTVGQEFLVAWCHRWTGSDLPLHVFAVHLMALVAALAAAGVYGVVLWRTGRASWAFLAATLFSVLPANYRTMGFVLVREDLSLPFLALHLALLARAVKRERARAYLLAGLAAGAALATWHAMSFFLALEVLVLALGLLRAEKSAFELRGAWAVLVGPVVAATLVPALAANGALLGLPLVLGFALLAVAVVRGRASEPLGRPRSIGVFLGSAAVLGVLGRLLSPGRSGYAHVFDVVLAKVRHLGVKPDDPTAIPFDARLLWQGPFETMQPGELVGWLGTVGLLLLLAVVAVALWRRRDLAGFELFLVALALASLPLAWCVSRGIVLLGLCLPMTLVLLARLPRRQELFLGLWLLTLMQTWSSAGLMKRWDLSWYRPVAHQEERAELVRWVRAHVDPAAPIAADFVLSPTLLAFAGNPIVLQPKYETEASRRRAQLFLETLFHGTPEEFRRVLRERFRTRHLVVDTGWLGASMQWAAGSTGTPPAGTAAALLLGREAPAAGAGYDLLFHTGAPDGPPGRLRLYALVD